MIENTDPKQALVKTDVSSRFLFLDDLRHPYDAFEHTKQTMFLQKKWEVVKNYKEFIEWIKKNGVPDFISFDHDLADTHYTPSHLWNDYDKSKEWQEQQEHEEKTGYECAKWLIDYCLDNNLKCPDFYCHSMNPVGKDKINAILTQFAQTYC